MVIFKEKHIFGAHQECVPQSSPLANNIQDHHQVGYKNILPLFLKSRSEIASKSWRSDDPNESIGTKQVGWIMRDGILQRSVALSQSPTMITHIIWSMQDPRFKNSSSIMIGAEIGEIKIYSEYDMKQRNIAREFNCNDTIMITNYWQQTRRTDRQNTYSMLTCHSKATQYHPQGMPNYNPYRVYKQSSPILGTLPLTTCNVKE